MNQPQFAFEFRSEVNLRQLGTVLREEAERQLRQLATGHTDIIGASVALEELTRATTPSRYLARIVTYARPQSVAAVEKGPTPTEALRGALDAVERQVREMRDKLRQTWKQP
jgi:ribosome-associated translation inhibitor RaiA